MHQQPAIDNNHVFQRRAIQLLMVRECFPDDKSVKFQRMLYESVFNEALMPREVITSMPAENCARKGKMIEVKKEGDKFFTIEELLCKVRRSIVQEKARGW
jgi:hypothetical protein